MWGGDWEGTQGRRGEERKGKRRGDKEMKNKDERGELWDGKEKGKNARREMEMGPTTPGRGYNSSRQTQICHDPLYSFLPFFSFPSSNLPLSLSVFLPPSLLSYPLSGWGSSCLCRCFHVSECPACTPSVQWPISGGGCSTAPQRLICR